MMDAFYDPGPIRDSSDPPTVVFRGYLFDDPPREVLDILRGSNACGHVLPPGSHDGLGAFPRRYADYLKSKAAHISKLSTDIYHLLLWRYGVLNGPPSLTTDSTFLFWAELPSQTNGLGVDSLKWSQVPSGAQLIDIEPPTPLDLRSEVGPCLTELMTAGVQSPLCHVLFREAWRIRESNFTSALVIGIAAAEAGVKEFIRNALPETSWLIENLQSPPLDKILKDYLPSLRSKAKDCQTVPPLSKEWRSSLCKAVEARNKVVHGRIVHLDQEYIEGVLNSVLKLLYFLDYHRGYDWAVAQSSFLSDSD